MLVESRGQCRMLPLTMVRRFDLRWWPFPITSKSRSRWRWTRTDAVRRNFPAKLDRLRLAGFPGEREPSDDSADRTAPSSWVPSAQTVDRSPEVSGSEQLFTIIGITCRFPAADGIPASCQLLEDGVNPVQERGSGSGVGHMGRLFPSAHVQSVASRYGAYLDGFDPFEATFFRISPLQPQFRDPHQLLMLETCSRVRGRTIKPRGHQGHPHRGLRGNHQQRIP